MEKQEKPEMKKQKESDRDLETSNKEEINEDRHRPYLIHSSAYSILTDQILMLMPSERNVLLSMNAYELHKVNPAHPRNSEAPTHVILFCIRFIADDVFQPIGGLLTYQHVDQSRILAECVKAYINDLWKLNLHVIATVSPPFELFKNILSHLITNIDINNHLDVITYSVEPITEIIHIYDVQFLIISLQDLLRAGDVLFKTHVDNTRGFVASWRDMFVVLNVAPEFKMLSDFFLSKDNVQRRAHIFTEQIFVKYLEVKESGLLSESSEGCIELLNVIRSFLKFFEYDFVHPQEYLTSDWSDLLDVLTTMTFQQSRVLVKSGNVALEEPKKPKSKKKSSREKMKAPKNDIFAKTSDGCASPFEDFCEAFRRTNCSGASNKDSKHSKTEAYDVKGALREMNCDINLVNYGKEGASSDEEKKRLLDVRSTSNEDIPTKCKAYDTSNKENSEKSDKEKRRNVEGYVRKIDEPPDCNNTNNFKGNSITQEFICTVKGIRHLMSLMVEKGVEQIKPDALIVEHIDYLVTKIQSAINNVKSVHYYGHTYEFMDTNLAFSTLSNTHGLYLVSKD
ncbi:unnamed protein product [Phyllotreta striolata]|uniref:Uncharacterized protein n=1 Tax=Phyllotreta striolata TaxID=444603 RepID=A0A9N9TRU0_PHYSR|nr:unnamed protein product [Phyllotreta striolata]